MTTNLPYYNPLVAGELVRAASRLEKQGLHGEADELNRVVDELLVLAVESGSALPDQVDIGALAQAKSIRCGSPRLRTLDSKLAVWVCMCSGELHEGGNPRSIVGLFVASHNPTNAPASLRLGSLVLPLKATPGRNAPGKG